MILKILKIISKVINKSIFITFKGVSYYILKNGSTIQTIPTSNVIRGNRAKYIEYYDDSYISTDEINKVLQPFQNTKGE